MTKDSKGLELKVGIFVLIGLAALATMTVYFGRLGEGLRGTYPVSVKFANASGLIKGAEVLMSGARVGRVSAAPQIVENTTGVIVPLSIHEGIGIPRNSEFFIGSSGLLGDRFVDIVPKVPEDGMPSEWIQPGAMVEGERQQGIEDLARTGDELLKQAIGAVEDVRETIREIRKEVVNPKTLKDINVTLENLKTTSEAFANSSKGIEEVVEDAKIAMKDTSRAVKAGERTMESTREAAEELNRAIRDVRSVVQQAKTGKGVIGTLLNDRQMAENVRIFIEGLRERGILFYRDPEKK